MIEEVVLVDEQDQEIGRMLKSEVHSDHTPLHRAFSSFIFNSNGEILLQQRAHSKNTWPLVWSNSCCGHPLPNETREHAVSRRLQDELGMNIDEKDIVFISPYRYQFVREGVVENEICPIYVAYSNDLPIINPDEVEATRWMKWEDYVQDTINHPENWSEWCVEEVALLDTSKKFKDWLETATR